MESHEFSRQVRRVLRDIFSAKGFKSAPDAPYYEFRRGVEKLFDKEWSKLDHDLRKYAMEEYNQAESEAAQEFKRERTASSEEIKNLISDQSGIRAHLRGAMTELQKDIMNEFVKSIARTGNFDDDKFVKALARRLKKPARQLAVEVNMARAGVSRSARVEGTAKIAGVVYRYVGPEQNIRQFCAENLNKLFTLEEIKKMDNGFDLDVLVYAGGYNCRHRWVAEVAHRKEGGVYVHSSWDNARSQARRPSTRNVMDAELASAREAAKHDIQIEFNADLANAYMATAKKRDLNSRIDIDAFVDGKPSNIKSVTSTHPMAIARAISKSRHQADTFLVVIGGSSSEVKEAFRLGERAVNAHSKNAIFVFKDGFRRIK